MLLCILTIFLSASVFLSGRSFTVFSFEFDVEFDTNADNCGDKPFIDKFMDISGAEYFRLTDSKLMVNGTLKVLQTYSKDKPIILKAYCQFKKRGQWAKIPYTYTLNDVCNGKFKEDEFFYSITTDSKGKARQCPPPEGTIIEMNETIIHTQKTFPVRIDEGEYKCDLEFTHGKKIIFCARMFGEVHEVL